LGNTSLYLDVAPPGYSLNGHSIEVFVERVGPLHVEVPELVEELL
jgi:hypothetical protein